MEPNTATQTPVKDNGVVTPHSGSVREVLLMSGPLVVAFLSFSLMSIVDTLIIGRVGTLQQGAVGLGGMLAWMLGTIFTGTMTVINTLVAQDHGAGRYANLRRHVHVGLLFIGPFVALIWLVVPYMPQLIELFGTDPAVAGYADLYISIRLLAMPLLLANFAFSSFLRGLGDMRMQMFVTVAANLINAALSIVLVFGYFGLPRMGVAGLAIGSVLAAMCETAMYMKNYFSRANHDRFQTRTWLRPTLADIGQFMKIGLPIGLSWFFDILGWTFFTVFASTLSPVDLAAHTIVFQLLHLSFLPTAAVSVVATTLVGQYLGARRLDLAERAARRTLWVGVGYMAFAGMMMILFRRPLIGLFNPDVAVIAVGAKIAIVAGIFQPGDGLWMVISGVLRGGGDTRFPMIAILLSSLCVFVPAVYLLGSHYGILGAWLGALVHVFFFAVVISLRYRQGRWKKALV
ncbi:MAG: MATE family efflux transporter [Candidatus Lernaella stagnicola]|nr:MATE family efflux transporter [Candidatus Lernaella stagnicola]